MDLNKWTCSAARLTAFFDAGLEPGQDYKTWEGLFDEPPESRTNKPKSQKLEENGEYEDGALNLVCVPSRFDMRYLTPLTEDTIGNFDGLGFFINVIDKFSSITNKWLDSSPQLYRLAFGVELFCSVNNREEGYLLLNDLLPSVTVDPNTSDFSYSINRRKDGSNIHEGLEFNRLSRWSVLEMRSGILIGDSSRKVPNKYAAALTLDINTVHKNDFYLINEKLIEIFSELISLGKEIAENGDIG